MPLVNLRYVFGFDRHFVSVTSKHRLSIRKKEKRKRKKDLWVLLDYRKLNQLIPFSLAALQGNLGFCIFKSQLFFWPKRLFLSLSFLAWRSVKTCSFQNRAFKKWRRHIVYFTGLGALETCSSLSSEKNLLKQNHVTWEKDITLVRHSTFYFLIFFVIIVLTGMFLGKLHHLNRQVPSPSRENSLSYIFLQLFKVLSWL